MCIRDREDTFQSLGDDLNPREPQTAMIFAYIYLSLGLLLLGSTLKVAIPRLGGRLLSAPLSFAAMVLVLFLPQFLVGGLLITALSFQMGALAHPAGVLSLGLHVACWSVLAGYLVRMHRAYPLLDGEPVRDEAQPFCTGLTDEEREQLKPGQIFWRPAFTFKIPEMLKVKVTQGVVFREIQGVRLRLDVYCEKREKDDTALRPAVIYIHGGGWVSGTRRQSRFMCHQLAAAGWVVFAISYRFAPRFPLPAAIEDCKAAVAWIREHGLEYGADADQLVAIGGSAGGHLTAMLALTPNVLRFQPGFEQADTRVQGAVVFYGVLDLVGPFEEDTNPALGILLEQFVFRSRYRDNQDLYRACSPGSYLTPDAPPILLVHGVNDYMVPVRESRELYRKLKEAGARTIHLLEIPLGLHAYDVAPSPLEQRTTRIIQRFMESLRRSAPYSALEEPLPALDSSVEQEGRRSLEPPPHATLLS